MFVLLSPEFIQVYLNPAELRFLFLSGLLVELDKRIRRKACDHISQHIERQIVQLHKAQSRFTHIKPFAGLLEALP
jgi:hypothetical protein